MKKRSLLERLAGPRTLDDDYGFEEDAATQAPPQRGSQMASYAPAPEDRAEGHLPIDMYQTPDDIVIRTFVAGVRPDELEVSINHDMVVIEGSREERAEVSGPDYFNQELFWGSFSRTVMLPQEVDVEGAQATSKDGLLTITLPKLDRARQTKLRVKAS